MAFESISYSDQVVGPTLYTFTLRFPTAILWFSAKMLVDLIAKTNETFSPHFQPTEIYNIQYIPFEIQIIKRNPTSDIKT